MLINRFCSLKIDAVGGVIIQASKVYNVNKSFLLIENRCTWWCNNVGFNDFLFLDVVCSRNCISLSYTLCKVVLI